MELRGGYKQELSRKEKSTINRIVGKYDLQVETVSKNRSVYKIKTDKNNICLKKIKNKKYKVKNGMSLVNELKLNGFNNTADYLKTTRDNIMVKYKNIYFYATEWIDGRECDMDNQNELIESIKLLAKFHECSKKINTKEIKIKNNLGKWPESFNKKLHDLDKFKNFIKNKRIKSSFDTKYYEYIDMFYKKGLISLSLLNSSNYYDLCRNDKEYKTICHNSFYYQNIIKKNEEYYLIDLNSIIFDLAIMDLGKFIRRIMYKKNYRWDFKKAKLIIEAYNSVNKISKDELEIMLALIIFPHKFWKLGRKKYVRHKNWNELKYSKRIEKIIAYNELEDKFIEDFLEYIKNY
ncbi:CotS family spore coat protein [Haloimpatiens lingqiaonensis]|uniref:CotS family spore coat protein n=1 Tax=Haloimpatiens lingqiaonensis TaxID=1380675 RepID=UPI0037BF433E